MAWNIFKHDEIETPDFRGDPLKILHLSDIHFRSPKYAVSRARAIRRFFRALDRHLEAWARKFPEFAQVDAVLVAGDVAYQGQGEDFDAAADFLGELLDKLHIGGERLYVVPGEHDVYLQFIKNTDDALQLPGPDEWNKLLRDERKGYSGRIAGRLASYQKFLHSLGRRYGTRIPSAASDFFFSDVFEHGEKKIAVLGLNSAWACRCRMDIDKGMLCLGEYQVERAWRDAVKMTGREWGPDFTMALLHHPAEWMKPGDKSALDDLVRRCDLAFRGHEHGGEDKIGNGEKFTPVISASCAVAGEPSPAFTFAAVDLEAKMVYAWHYPWDEEKREFMPAGKISGQPEQSSFYSYRVNVSRPS